jgi:hypothetical protein
MLADTEEVALSFEQTTIGSNGNLLQTDRLRLNETFPFWNSNYLKSSYFNQTSNRNLLSSAFSYKCYYIFFIRYPFRWQLHNNIRNNDYFIINGLLDCEKYKWSFISWSEMVESCWWRWKKSLDLWKQKGFFILYKKILIEFIRYFLFLFKNNQLSNNMNSAILESTAEVNLFWASIILADLIWLAFLLIAFLTLNFKWMVMTINEMKLKFLKLY